MHMLQLIHEDPNLVVSLNIKLSIMSHAISLVLSEIFLSVNPKYFYFGHGPHSLSERLNAPENCRNSGSFFSGDLGAGVHDHQVQTPGIQRS